MIRMTAVALLLALAPPADACRLSISPAALHGRIAGMKLRIEGAAISTASIKPGWELSVTNDPSWKTDVTGHAIVGAAFLSAPEFQDMLTVLPEPGIACGDLLQEKSAVFVELTFYKADRLVRAQIGKHAIRFVP